MVKSYRNHSTTFNVPRKRYEKERLEQEVKICGEYGLKNKKEVYRVQLVLANLRKRARELLTLEEDDTRRIFEGNSLLKKMFKYGLLDQDKENGLDYVLSLTIQKFLERRLQTRVFKSKLAQSIHQARVLIQGKHIAVNNQLVNVPSFLVSIENENQINFHDKSPLNGKRLGRKKRKNRDKNQATEEK